MNNGAGLSDNEVIKTTIELVQNFNAAYAEVYTQLLWIRLDERNSVMQDRLDNVSEEIKSCMERASNLLDWARGCESLDYLPSNEQDFQTAYDLAGDLEDQSRMIKPKMQKLYTDHQRVKDDMVIFDKLEVVRSSVQVLVDIYQNTYDLNKR